MKYNEKSAETVVKNKKRKDTTKEKELTLDDMIQRIFYENSDKSILALYPKYSTEPNINNAESTDEYNRKATTYWNNQKELSEIEKYLNFLRRPEPNPSDYATMEEYVKIATDYWEGRKRLLENNKYKTDMIADALSIWRNIQEERNPYKQNTMLIEFKEWLAENDMKDYVPGEPYLYPIEINPNAVTSGYGDKGDVAAGQKVRFGDTTYEGANSFGDSTPNIKLLNSENSYVDKNGLFRMRLKSGENNSENDYYFVAISKGLAQDLCNKLGYKDVNEFALGSTFQFTFGDVNGKISRINVVVADVKETEDTDMYPHTTMVELVAEKDILKSSGITTGGNVSLDKWFDGKDTKLIAMDYIIDDKKYP